MLPVACVGGWFIAAFAALHFHWMPYAEKKLNNLELSSLMCIYVI